MFLWFTDLSKVMSNHRPKNSNHAIPAIGVVEKGSMQANDPVSCVWDGDHGDADVSAH